MARILCATELGGNYGHLTQLLPLVRLLAQGHELIVALPAGLRADPWLDGCMPVSTVVAPVQPRRSSAAAPATYADILHAYAFREVDTLAAATTPWDALIQRVKPDAVLLNAAPVASLAARRAGVTRLVVGDGFALPPMRAPLLGFRPDREPDGAAEESVVESTNALLPPAHRVSAAWQLARGEHDFLATLPELDHYPLRRGEDHVGPLFETESGKPPIWPESTGGRIFAYLAKGSSEARLLDEALQLCDLRALRYEGDPLRMRDVLDECDLVVCHGGHGTVAATLLAGKPLLLMPQHIEQLLTAKNVVALGAGLAVAPKEESESVAAKLRALLCVAEHQHAAARFMAKYLKRNSKGVAEQVSDEIDRRIGHRHNF